MPNKRPRGPQPRWRPKRETLRVLTAVDAVLDRYRDHLPVSLRQLFYVLLSDSVLEKSERDYKRMCEYVGMARRSGRITWEAIRDDTQVAVDAPPFFAGPTSFWEAVAVAADDYRVDRQGGQPVRLELWCETGGMVPQLVRIGGEFGIATYSGGGFDGLVGKHSAAERAIASDRKTIILHLGDLDPSGIWMFTALSEDVKAFAAVGNAEVEFERVAVTEDQVQTYELPTAPPKPTDWRAFSGTTTQAEALPPDILATIVREAIEAHRDSDVHQRTLAREEAERREIRRRLGPGC
jgi:hypothetical protein